MAEVYIRGMYQLTRKSEVRRQLVKEVGKKGFVQICKLSMNSRSIKAVTVTLRKVKIEGRI